MLLVSILLLILSCIFLVLSGIGLVKSLTKISYFLRISEYIIAFVLMAAATSLPELLVGITSAMNKVSSLSLGNVIGSNIADIALVGSIAILVARGIKVKSKKIKKDVLLLIPLSILPIILFFIGNALSRTDGVILIIAAAIYFRYVIQRRKGFKKKIKEKVTKLEAVFYSMSFLVFLFLLFFSAHFVVKYAVEIARSMNVSYLLIGLFMVALGTSLPELTFETIAVRKHPEMALGDLIGSIAINCTVVLGITALICPITSSLFGMLITSAFMFIFIFLFATFVHSGSKLYVMEGVALLLLYLFFIFIEFYFKLV